VYLWIKMWKNCQALACLYLTGIGSDPSLVAACGKENNCRVKKTFR